MPGYDQSRFTNLTERDNSHLVCSICLAIFENAVNADCGHSFCKDCIQQYIQSNTDNKDCPQCRTQFTRIGPDDSINNLVIIEQFVFKRNFVVNGMINDLQIRCKFESNGCQAVTALGLLSSHLNECELNLCSTCDLKVGNPETHNCVEQLISSKNEIALKFNELVSLSSQLSETSEALYQKALAAKTAEVKTDLLRDHNDYLANELAGQKRKVESVKRIFKETNEQNLNLEVRNSKLKKKSKKFERKCQESEKNCSKLAKLLDQERDKSKGILEESSCKEQDFIGSIIKLENSFCEFSEDLQLLEDHANICLPYKITRMGNYQVIDGTIRVLNYGICFPKFPVNNQNGQDSELDVIIPFKDITGINYCRKYPAIYILPSLYSCLLMEQALNMGVVSGTQSSDFINCPSTGNQLNVGSYGKKKWYIIVVLDDSNGQERKTFLSYLTQKSKQDRFSITFKTVDNKLVHDRVKELQAQYIESSE